MSHGGSSEGGACEPNLTPLLDVVLQLLMFFMMCVNFVTEQVNEDIKLPRSASVKPMDKADSDILFLNFKPFHLSDFEAKLPADALARAQANFHDGDPCILVLGKEPMKLIELGAYLKQQYEDAEKVAKDGKVNTAIVIRAHLDSDYAQVFEVLHMCKVRGYTRLKLRAMTKNTPGA
jgi:biopolymer transport protein ExbD